MAVKQKHLSEILTVHRQRYPLMEPADYGKLLYQNEFGPEHMITNPEDVRAWLLKEWEETVQPQPAFAAAKPAANIEEIGNHLFRFHLIDGYDIPIAAPLLARLFFLTAKQHQGTAEGLREKLTLLREYSKKPDAGFPNCDSWLDAYLQAGCPSLHHSEIFRQAYAPHYRILRDVYAIYFPVIYEVQKRLAASEHILIAIDGPCGGGKSSLAELLAELFPSRLLHMDDYYLPLERRAPDWEQTPCGNMDLERFRREALLPAGNGESVLCRPYSCQQGKLLDAIELPAAPLTIVEGSYSHHPLLAPQYDLKIFLHCQRQEQLARLRRREGAHYDAYLQRWIPLEEAYYQTYHILSDCDMSFDNTAYFE